MLCTRYLKVKAPKRLRGKTRMERVYKRPFDARPILSMNELFQPISCDDKIISEFSNFLGTLKKYVPLTCASWDHVPDDIKNTLWNYVKVSINFK